MEDSQARFLWVGGRRVRLDFSGDESRRSGLAAVDDGSIQPTSLFASAKALRVSSRQAHRSVRSSQCCVHRLGVTDVIAAAESSYAVFMPYVMPGVGRNSLNYLILLALPRGLEPLFSP
jgi:hypothetical protein